MKKKASKFPGVRYREHPTRRNGPHLDRCFFIRYKRAGKLVEEPVGWSSEGANAEDANDLRSAIRKAIRTGSGPQSLAEMREAGGLRRQAEQARREAEDRAAIPLRAIARRYVEWTMHNKRSWREDEKLLDKHILPALGDLPATTITAAHVEALKQKVLLMGRAPATVRHILGLVRRLFNWAATTPYSVEIATPLYTGTNPVTGVRMPTVDNARTAFLTYEQADILLEAAQGYPKERCRGDLSFHDVCLLSLNTGLRKGEILALRWEHVDLAHGILHVRDPKAGQDAGHAKSTHGGGTVPLNEDAADMFQRRKGEALAAGTLAGLVFPGRRGGARMRRVTATFKEMIGELGWNNGIEDARQLLTFHSLRHTFASWLALQGEDIYRIQALMRHKTIQQTMRYAHLIPEVKRDAVDRLARRRKAAGKIVPLRPGTGTA